MVRIASALGTLMILASTVSSQFVEKKTVGLAIAKKIAAAAVAEAAKNHWTMAITILDDGGNLVYLEHMDGTQIGSIDVSQGKARTALRFKRPSKEFADGIAKGNNAIITLDNVTTIQGGLPILVDGQVAGAIGGGGATSEQDEQCALAGLKALSEK